MNIAYAPILREQFNQLYRFGNTTIPVSILVETEDAEQPSQDDCQRVAEKLTKLSPFEYEEEYVILQLLYPAEGKSGLITISIRDVRRVFPLNVRSKEFFESRLDTRIKFQTPVFENFIASQYIDRIWRDAEQAVRGLWEYFGFSNAHQEAWELISKEEIQAGLNARLHGIKAHTLENVSYWAYVIAYDRYEDYPAHTLGYFYDAGHLYANKRGFDSFVGSSLHKLLEELRSTMTSSTGQFPKIKQTLEGNTATERYCDDTSFADNQEQRLRGYLITPMFLMLKEQLRNSDEVKKTFLFSNDVRNQFSESEFKVLLTLLGCFFGYRKFYDVFYEHPPLSIFSKEPSLLETGKSSSKPEILTNKPAQTDSLTGETNRSHTSEPKIPVSLAESTPKTSGEVQTEQVDSLPELADADMPGSTTSTPELSSAQLPLFSEPPEPSERKKKAGRATKLQVVKSDQDLLNELVKLLAGSEREKGVLLSKLEKSIKGSELLSNDSRFCIRGKRVFLRDESNDAI